MRSNLLQAVAAVLEEALTETHDGRGSRVLLRCTHHEALVGHLQAGDTIISYNYDCLMDCSLRTAGANRWNAYYGYGLKSLAEQDKLGQHPFWSPDNDVAAEQETAYLLKLHGSLNFQRADAGGIRLKIRPYTRQRGDLNFEIIAPEPQKPFDEGLFRPLWQHASRAVNATSSMVLIGYSFPQTDLHSAALFRSSVGAGALRKLTIVNPDDTARSRAIDVLRRGLAKTTRIIEFDTFREFVRAPRALWGS